MKKNLLTFGIILLSALNIHSQSVNLITPNAGIQGQTLSVSISGTNMNFGNQWSGLSDFRFSQFSGLNMFYGIPTGTIATSASASDLYGDVSIPNGQNTGWYDLEVQYYNTNQWVQKNNAFYVNPVSTTASWNCISPGNCQDPGTGNGLYSTQAACLSACVVPSWDCDVQGNCYDPGNGLGQYTTQSACLSQCVSATYDCINNSCVDPGTGNGTFSSLTACQNNCVITPTWDCANGICIDPGTGTGQYSSLASCETECDSSTSIISQEIEYLTIYPNPTNGILNIQFSILNSQDIMLNLVNTVGEVIFTERLSNYIGEYNKQINLESYSKAIYFLEIKTDNGIVNKKLILQ